MSFDSLMKSGVHHTATTENIAVPSWREVPFVIKPFPDHSPQLPGFYTHAFVFS